MLKFRPLADRVLVKRFDPEEKVGSLYVPTNAQEKPLKAEVLAVGPGKLLDDGELSQMNVVPGNVVYIMKYGGYDIQIEGEKYTVLREEEILGIADE